VRYWWVNQNQTFRQELDGGYLWSPKRNKNGHRNPFYEFMRQVAPGDIVFSLVDSAVTTSPGWEWKPFDRDVPER
jgi:putative restriction endonuclease